MADFCKYCGVKTELRLPGDTWKENHTIAVLDEDNVRYHWTGCMKCFKAMPQWGPQKETAGPANISKEELRTLLYDLGLKGLYDSKQRRVFETFLEEHNL